MTTRRSFLQKLPVIAGVATLTDSNILLAQVKRRSSTGQSKGLAVCIYIALSEKNRLDYSYKRPVEVGDEESPLNNHFRKAVEAGNEASFTREVCTKRSHKKLTVRLSKGRNNSRRSRAAAARTSQNSTNGEGDYFVVSGVVTTDVRGLKRALPTLNTATYKASKANQHLKKLIYQELSDIRPDYKNGFEVNEVYLEKKGITAHYKTRCGSINKNLLYARMIEVLLESFDLVRFKDVLVCPDVKVIRNVSKKKLRKHFVSNPRKAPKRRFDIRPVDRLNHTGLKVANFVNHALLQSHQAYPLPSQNLQWHNLIRKFVKKRVDVARMI